MTTMLAPILLFCAVGALAVAATVLLAWLMARSYHRKRRDEELRAMVDAHSGRDAGGSARR